VTLARALTEHGFRVLTRHEVFAANQQVDDPMWLDRCGRERWVAITKDKGIRHRPAEIQMVLQARVRMFIISAGGLTALEQAELIVEAIPAMRRWVLSTPPPFAVRIMSGARTVLVAHAPRRTVKSA
jgi:hypothetical protein